LSGLKICPKGPERTESMVPGSRSTRIALGTYLPPPRDRETERERDREREIERHGKEADQLSIHKINQT